MIISGGFNVYPSDLEAVLGARAGIARGGVVGAPSTRWGETPVAFVVAAPGAKARSRGSCAPGPTRGSARPSASPRFGSSNDLPRSAIGKVLKRELREMFGEAD